jgi:2',3'-cyclic-nucleotide 2'-phosphodiesterase (5'-nucleotidase family)
MRLILVLAALAVQAQELRRLSIIHTNDLHARFLPDDKKLGGFAYVAAAINEQRKGCKHCLVLNAGDLVQGSPVSTMFKGTPVYELANKFKFDASTLGNHEFDYGWRQVPTFLKKARFPIVSANVVNDAGAFLADRPYVIKKVNGIRVAIIGAAMANLVSGFLTDITAGPWKAQPVAEAAKRVAAELKEKADVIVLLGHIHEKEGSDVLQVVPEVDVVVEGHDHRGRTQLERVADRVAVGCQGYGREICRLDLEIKMPEGKIVTAEWKKIPVEAAKIAPHPAMARVVDKWEKRVSAAMDVKIATAARTFPRADLVPLMERAFREELKADFAVMNRGGVRDQINQGDILVRHIWNIAPFDNRMMIARAKGAQLAKFIKEGETVEPEKVYVITTSDYLVNNAESRAGLGLEGIRFEDTPDMMRDVFARWVKKQGVIR